MTEQEFQILTDKEKRGVATESELMRLEPYRAKRAVFMAAGFGSRLVPLTYETPKPLVSVLGTRLIDTLLDAVLAAGIEEIYIVRGYLAGCFDVLLEKYPMIKFIENPLYGETNNISSVLAASEFLENAYVFEADLKLENAALVSKYQYESNFLGVPTAHTDDWCFTTENGVIQSVQRGGDDCHHMFGVSYWTARDGAKLREDIRRVFETPEGRNVFFEAVPLTLCCEHYDVHVRECTFDDIMEIDTLDELKAVDESYRD